MRWLAVILMALAMAGCGQSDADKVSQRVNLPQDVVANALALASVDNAKAYFPGIAFERNQPASDQMQFTVPGSNGSSATILFTFTPLSGGKATRVQADLDIPEVVASIDGHMKVLSQDRVAKSLRATLRRFNRRGGEKMVTEEMSEILLALAISTNDGFLARAKSLRDKPSAAVTAIFDDDEDAESPENNPEEELAVNNDPTSYQRPADESERFQRESAPQDDSSANEEDTEYEAAE